MKQDSITGSIVTYRFRGGLLTFHMYRGVDASRVDTNRGSEVKPVWRFLLIV